MQRNTIMICLVLIKTKKLSGGRKKQPPQGNGMEKTVLMVRQGDWNCVFHIGAVPALLCFFLTYCNKAGLGNGENIEGQKTCHNAMANQE